MGFESFFLAELCRPPCALGDFEMNWIDLLDRLIDWWSTEELALLETDLQGGQTPLAVATRNAQLEAQRLYCFFSSVREHFGPPHGCSFDSARGCGVETFGALPCTTTPPPPAVPHGSTTPRLLEGGVHHHPPPTCLRGGLGLV